MLPAYAVFLPVAVAAILFAGMLACVALGYRLGERARVEGRVSADSGGGTVEAAVLGLLGLTLALTFTSAAERLAVRRAQIVQEANAIGTAYLRVDLLPAAEQPAIRALFRDYLEARIAVYDKFQDRAASSAALDRGGRLQRQIWSRTVAATQHLPAPEPGLLVLQALNDMIDITTTRTMAALTHAPLIIVGLLVALSFLGALLAGFGMALKAQRTVLHALLFALAISITVYVVLDLEYPRVGLITLSSMDRALVDLRSMMQ